MQQDTNKLVIVTIWQTYDVIPSSQWQQRILTLLFTAESERILRIPHTSSSRRHVRTGSGGCCVCKSVTCWSCGCRIHLCVGVMWAVGGFRVECRSWEDGAGRTFTLTLENSDFVGSLSKHYVKKSASSRRFCQIDCLKRTQQTPPSGPLKKRK